MYANVKSQAAAQFFQFLKLGLSLKCKIKKNILTKTPHPKTNPNKNYGIVNLLLLLDPNKYIFRKRSGIDYKSFFTYFTVEITVVREG